MQLNRALVVWFVVLLGAVGGLTGCGSDRKASGSGAEPVKFPPIRTDQEQAAPGSPGAAVVRLWSHLRNGMLPVALNAFEPDVVEQVGRETFIGGLNVARDITTPLAPTIVRTDMLQERDSGGGDGDGDGDGAERLAMVFVEGRGSQGALLRSTFLLRRSGFGWLVVYDTVLDSGLRTFVATSRQQSPVPRERLAEQPAAQAGASVARQYQSVANDLIGRSF